MTISVLVCVIVSRFWDHDIYQAVLLEEMRVLRELLASQGHAMTEVETRLAAPGKRKVTIIQAPCLRWPSHGTCSVSHTPFKATGTCVAT